MFFYNKKLMRQAGYDDAFIEGLPDAVLKGEVTMDDLIDIAKKVQDKTGVKYGILHRPSKGPDYIMVFQAYGNTFTDPKTGNLMLDRDKLAAAFGWFEKGVKEGVLAANNTSMEWDDIRAQFYKDQNAVFWMYGIWDLGSSAFPTFGLPQDEASFFKDWGWVACPPVEKGGSPSSLTHPVDLRGLVEDASIPISPSGCSASPRTRTSTPTTPSRRRISASSRSSLTTRATPTPGRSPRRRRC